MFDDFVGVKTVAEQDEGDYFTSLVWTLHALKEEKVNLTVIQRSDCTLDPGTLVHCFIENIMGKDVTTRNLQSSPVKERR